jgi:putative nucleotidyltransferase with HDIG domain
VLHTLRVEAYTTRILSRENHPLPEGEVTLLRLAAILHDIGRMEKREEHAKLGAEIARQWLLESHLPEHDVKRVVGMIADHSNKANPEPDYSKAVLKDADTLDEIGAMSIFMAATWVDMRSPFFFHDLRQRLIDVEIPFCERKLGILNTREAFMENFIAQITDELQADARIEQLLIRISKNGTEEITEGDK